MACTKKSANMKLRKSLTVTAFLLFVNLSLSSACFVRNCPTGGKRSVLLSPLQPARQCMPCGATVGGRSVLGVCVSENTCCVAHLGCFVNTEESKVCALENHLSTPCRLEGPPCGSDGQDVCAVEGICCAGQNCRYDAQC
uniref:Annetocin n=2 Tax=Eisenia fetida TaxID=6396 RepID=Q9U083_EISFE|nr:Annetocin precursor [Eisenia fetida]BAD93374.1 annetocin precursor [Eisenia fetida]